MKTNPRATRAVSCTVVATETLKELCMKISRALTFLFSAALLLSSAAIGGETNKGTLRLSDNVVIQGKTVNSGKYTVEWDGSGPTVQVTLLSGKQTVATFPAHVTEQTSPNAQDSYSTASEPNGSRSLTAIYPGGKRVVLQVDQNQASK
jgi:hypothetical protein